MECILLLLGKLWIQTSFLLKKKKEKEGYLPAPNKYLNK